ncbi:MAG: enhanced intracellular survival protein Eis [Spirochaetales bacterium]
MNIRELKTGDISQMISLWRYAFRDISDAEPSADERARYLSNYGLGVFEGEQLASALLVHPLKQAVRRRVLSMGGIGAVASFPEHRGKGYVSALMARALEAMHERGHVVSMLAPFKQGFYERYGYVSAQPELTVRTSLDRLSHWLERGVYPADYETIRAPAVEMRQRFCSVADQLLPQSHGRAFRPDVGESEWRARVGNREAVILRRGDEDVAAFHFSKRHTGDAGPCMSVSALFAADSEALEAVLGFLAAHRDQIEILELSVGVDAPIWRWFSDGSQKLTLTGGNPWMVRIVDVIPALEGTRVGYPEGTTCIRVDDLQCEWNNRVFRLESNTGQLHIEEASDAPADVTLSIEQLSALLYGVRPAFRYRRTPDELPNTATSSLLTGWFSNKAVRNDWFF